MLPEYIEVPACAALAPYVRCYWALSGCAPVPQAHRVLPDGCLDILVDLCPAPSTERLRVVGAMRRASVVPLSGEVCFLGIRFRPGGAHPFLRFSLDSLTDETLGLDHLWPREAREWEERLWEAPGLGARVRELERELLRRLPPARDEAVAHAVGLIGRARGQVRLGALEEALGVGTRQLERRFRAAVGLTPKVLCRIERMRHATSLLDTRPRTAGAWLALETGYYDQAHLGREFLALTGLTPGAYARERERVGFVQAPG